MSDNAEEKKKADAEKAVTKAKAAEEKKKAELLKPLEVQLTLYKDMRLCYQELADKVRDVGFKQGKLGCKVNIKLLVKPGKDYLTQQNEFLRLVGLTFTKGATLNIEVKNG